MIHMKLVDPTGSYQKMFECQEEGCGDIVSAGRINNHAQKMHHTTEVVVDASLGFGERSRERKNPMCELCNHSMWFHNHYGLCSKCDMHDLIE